MTHFQLIAEIGDLQKLLLAETWPHMLTEVKISKAAIHTLERMCLIRCKKDWIKFFYCLEYIYLVIIIEYKNSCRYLILWHTALSTVVITAYFEICIANTILKTPLHTVYWLWLLKINETETKFWVLTQVLMDWKSLCTSCACRTLINNQRGALNVLFIAKSFGNPAKITTYPFTHVNCVREGSRQHQEVGTDLLGAPVLPPYWRWPNGY